MATQRTSETRTIKCPRCEGLGTLAWTNVDNGRCFACGGAKTITVKRYTDSEQCALDVGLATHLAEACMADMDMYGVLKPVTKHHAGKVAEYLMRVGTENARGVLQHITAGAYTDDYYNEKGTLAPGLAKELVDYVIAKGRAMVV